jgi:Icc-related predicted phosphoesterase
VADVHGRKENLDRIERTVREYRPDAVVAAGTWRRGGMPLPSWSG